MKYLILTVLIIAFQNCSKGGIEHSSIKKVKSETIENLMFSEVQIDNVNIEKSVWKSTPHDVVFLESLAAEFNYPEYFLHAEVNVEVEAREFVVSLPMKVQVKRYCAKPSSGYSTLASATKLTFQVLDQDNNVLCQSSDLGSIRDSIQKNKLIDSECRVGLNNHSKYFVKLVNENNQTMIVNNSGHGRIGKPFVEFKIHDNKLVNSGNTLNVMSDVRGAKSAKCDQTASPLVIDFRKDTKKMFQLTSPEMGVSYDILGMNSYPVAHDPIQISWLSSSNIGFLVLPDSMGKVIGIDQLFGDNTKGPDGQTSENGFHALQKYDGLDMRYSGTSYSTSDLVIDERDDIFNSLKVWKDQNLDGRTQSGELHSLTEVGIVSIDLRYDPRFREVDQFGNEIRFKSLVTMNDGSFRLIFDIWFNYSQ